MFFKSIIKKMSAILTVGVIVLISLVCSSRIYAWDNSSELTNGDISQIAYAAVLSNTKKPNLDILKANNGTEYKEILKYLCLSDDDIVFQKNKNSNNGYDGSSGFVHAKLTKKLDGNGYITQSEQKELELVWTGFAYKFVQYGFDTDYSDDERAMLSIIDPYNQLATKENKATKDISSNSECSDSVNSGDSITIYEDDELTELPVLTLKQLRLRTLGMLLHTIEDAEGPYNCIRNNNGVILAFARDELQSFEEGSVGESYCKLSSSDKDSYESLISDTSGFTDVYALRSSAPRTEFYNSIDTLSTYRLSQSIRAAEKIITFEAENSDWNSVVRPWINDEVFLANFDENGESRISEGGFKFQNLRSDGRNLIYIASKLKEAVNRNFKGRETESQGIYDSVLKLEQCQKDLAAYYSNGEGTYDDIINNGRNAAYSFIENMNKITEGKSITDFQVWSEDERKGYRILVEDIGGFAQEFFLANVAYDNLGDESLKAKVKTIADLMYQIPVSGVTFDSDSVEVNLGDKSVSLSYNIIPFNAFNKDVVWESSDTSVVTVDDKGNLTPISVGEAKITVRTIEGSTLVESKDTQKSNDDHESTEESEDVTEAAEDETTGAEATGATEEETTDQPTEDNIRTGGFTAECTVKVLQPVTSVKLSEESLTMNQGDTHRLEASVLPDNASKRNVIWKSSDSNIASVSDTGVVTAKGDGIVLITVESEDGSHAANCEVVVYGDKAIEGSDGSNENKEFISQSLDNMPINYPLLFIVIGIIAALIGCSFIGIKKDNDDTNGCT